MRELTIGYTHASHIGYGRMGMGLHQGLTGLGVDVYDRIRSPLPLDPADARGREKATNLACWMSYPSHVRGWLDGQRRVLLTMFETDTLPEVFRAPLPNFDQILVPSEQNGELFSRYHPNVAVVPLGVDPARWHYRPRQEPENEFRFMVGGSGERKGGDLAVRAFKKVFGNYSGSGPEPWLIVKAPKPEDFYGERVRVLTGYLSDDEEVALYSSVHCYLQPSRGEGFGLQPLQAIAQGIPTILTGAHGHAAFARLGISLASTKVPSGYFMVAGGRGAAGNWWEPSFDELCEAMEFVYSDYATALAHARKGADEVARSFTWADSAGHFLRAVGEEHLSVPYSGTGAWIEATEQLFRTVLLKPYAAEIAGVHYQWGPGQDYYESAETKRILLEADVLDPACIDADSMGLSPEVAEEYSARHAYCWACHQRLGTGMTKADEIFMQLEAEATR